MGAFMGVTVQAEAARKAREVLNETAKRATEQKKKEEAQR